MKKRILIVGIGLIGGSIALAMKKLNDVTVVGYDIDEKQGQEALSLHVIDEYSSQFEEEAMKADVIILSCPVHTICHYIERLSKIEFDHDVIISDVGSTKKLVMEKAETLHSKYVSFIGGHPMAGSHKTGVIAAKPHLFENAFYILIPSQTTSDEKIEEFESLLAGANANFVKMTTDEHDSVMGVVSHFPHLIAAGLVRCAFNKNEEHPIMSRMAAGGFRDVTRIASSSPTMWRDIILSNRENMLEMLDDWNREMSDIYSMIEKADGEGILEFFSNAKSSRDSLPIQKQGAIPNYCDLYVDILDRPGAIAHVTSLLEAFQINIKNINIIEAREDLFGALHLSFQTEADRLKAKDALEKVKYDTHIIL